MPVRRHALPRWMKRTRIPVMYRASDISRTWSVLRLDCEHVGALVPVPVDGENSPEHAIHTRREGTEADAQELPVLLVHPRVTLVHAMSGRVRHLDRAERSLDLASEEDADLRGAVVSVASRCGMKRSGNEWAPTSDGHAQKPRRARTRRTAPARSMTRKFNRTCHATPAPRAVNAYLTSSCGPTYIGSVVGSVLAGHARDENLRTERARSPLFRRALRFERLPRVLWWSESSRTCRSLSFAR